MSRFQDAVRRVKNMFTINNVYDCARPILLLLGLFGVGATRISNTEGVYTLHNTRYTTFITVFLSVICAPYWMIKLIYSIFQELPSWNVKLSMEVYYIIGFIRLFITMFTISVAGIMASVSCNRLDRVLQIIHNVDRQLSEVNIRVKHWQITLKLAVLAVVNVNYKRLLASLRRFIKIGNYEYLLVMLLYIVYDLLFLWVILFVLIIHERFVCLTKVLQQDATITNIHIVGERTRRDNYVLRRVQLARHVDEQLTEAVLLFSDLCRYVVLALLTGSMTLVIQSAFALLVQHNLGVFHVLFTAALRIVLLTFICQANKNERRVRTARIRHLLAFETNREIVQQLQQYIMYNAYSTPGLIDFQFADINHILLFAIIDVIVSNILIIYSYTRQWD